MIDSYMETVLWWASGLSLACLVATVVGVPWVVARLPHDYFNQSRRAAWRQTGEAPWFALLLGALKNAVGALLVLLGVVMLVTPGQGLLTLLVGLLSKTAVLSPLLPSFWVRPHLGASGAVMGVLASWGLVYANEEMHFIILGRMKGKTFVLIIIAIELLRALSFDGVSSTSHFGGMFAGLVLCRGLWRPSKWQEIFRRARLQKQRRRVEHELKVLEGGKGTRGPDGPPKGPDPKDPKYWN